MILVKTKRNIGFAPLGSGLSNENGHFASLAGGGGWGDGHPGQISSPNAKFSYFEPPH